MKGYKKQFDDKNLKYSKKLSKDIFSLPLFELRDYEVKNMYDFDKDTKKNKLEF